MEPNHQGKSAEEAKKNRAMSNSKNQNSSQLLDWEKPELYKEKEVMYCMDAPNRSPRYHV